MLVIKRKRIDLTGSYGWLLYSTIIGYGIISFIDLNWLYQIENDVVSYKALLSATLFVFAGILIRFFLTTVSSVFYALQMSAVNNFLHLSVSISQLLFVLLAPSASPEESLVRLAIAYMILSNLPVLIAGIVVFCTKLKQCRPGIRYIGKKHLKIVMGIGSVFFICQILYMLIVNTNEFLITNLFGPQYTTEYTFYHKISNMVSMVVTLAMTPVWSVITKAMAEKNYIWLKKLYKRVKLFGWCAVLLQFICVPFQQIIMNIWLGKGVLDVNYLTALSFAFFGGVFVYSGILSTIVCGMARMKLQTAVYGIGVAAKFLIVYLLKDIAGSWTIVVWSNVIILLPYCILQQIDLNIYLNKLAKSSNESTEETKC